MEPLSLSNRYKVRCAQITSQESIYRAESLSRTRLSLSLACYLGEGLPNIPLKQSTNVFPAFFPECNTSDKEAVINLYL